MNKLTAKQTNLLNSIKTIINANLSIELFNDMIVGVDSTHHQIKALANKGVIRLVEKSQSKYLSCKTYGACLSVELA